MKIHLKLMADYIIIALIFLTIGCSGGGDSGSENPQENLDIRVTGISLNKSSALIQVGKTDQLEAIITPSDATNQDVTWSSSDESKAAVSSSGLVTAVAEGTATITVTTVDGGFAASCTVSSEMIYVTNVSLNKSTTSVSVGSSAQLEAIITPSDAINQDVVWSSSDESMATVSSSGLVTGVALGGATITVTTSDGNFTAACVVTVRVVGEIITYTADSLGFQLVFVPGGKTFPANMYDSGTATVGNPYWIGETEVTYELWKKVYDWATTDAGGGKRSDGGVLYYFANQGREGHDGAIDASSLNLEPVTTVNWRDSIVFCNALSEWLNAMNGTQYIPVYSYSNIILRDSRDSNAAACDGAEASSTTIGFRLLTSNEWELAARWRTDSTNTVAGYTDPYFTKGNSLSGAYTFSKDTADTNPANGFVDSKDANDIVAVYGDYYGFFYEGTLYLSWMETGVTGTAEVKSKGVDGANSLGLYDMSGNVSEWCFDLKDSSSERINRGGNWAFSADLLEIGYAGSLDPFYEYVFAGFRIARSE